MPTKNFVIVAVVVITLGFNVSLGYMAFTEPPNYLITATPEITSLYQGDSVTFKVTLASLRNFDSQVTLRAAEIPEGVEVTFDKNVTQLTSEENVTFTVNVKVDPEAPAGLYDLVVEANSGGLIHTATEQLNIIGTGSIVVIIKDFWYYPDNLTIRKGSEVTWVNRDLTGHTATADNGEFDTDLLRQNQRYTVVFDQVGKHPYYCVPHPQMVGVVRVVE
ncbi:MAG: plastocyanin/azurin family copper-binding protein [Nitrososphaerales archaeon]